MRHQNFRPQGPRIPNITELMIGSQRPLQSSLSASSFPGSDWYLNGRLWANCSQGQIRVGSIRKRIPDASKQKLSNVLVLTARDTQEKKAYQMSADIPRGLGVLLRFTVSGAQSEGGIYLPDIALSGQPTFCANLSSLRSFILLNLRQFTLFPQISSLPGCPQGRLVFQVFPHPPVFEHSSRHWCLRWLWKSLGKFYSLAIKSSASCAHYSVTREFPAPVAMHSLSVMSFSP